MRSVDRSEYLTAPIPIIRATSAAFVAVELRVLLGDCRGGPFDRFVEQVDELDRVARAAAQHLAVVAEHAAEADVDRLDRWLQPAGHLRHLEHHLEVLGLGSTDDVQQQVGSEPLDAVEHTGEIAGGVHVGAGARPHDQRERLVVTVREPGREHHLGAVVLLDQPGRFEAGVGIGHQRLVAALAG